MTFETFKLKSEENFKAAELLSSHTNKFCNALIHCFYYSCFQQSKFVYLEAGNPDSLEAFRNSHDKLINQVFKEIDNQKERIKAVEYITKMGELKMLRVKSDYMLDKMGEPEVVKARQISTQILEILRLFK